MKKLTINITEERFNKILSDIKECWDTKPDVEPWDKLNDKAKESFVAIVIEKFIDHIDHL